MVDRFVGRVEEMRALSALLEDCRRGAARAAVVTGQAGAGKTTLLDHVAAQARHSGFRVLAVRCDVGEVPIPFDPLRIALDEVEEDAHPLVDQVRSMVGERWGGGLRTSREGCSSALGLLLEHWAERSPVLLTVDDLHAADADTAAVAMSLVRSLTRRRVSAIVTARPTEMTIKLGEEVRRAVARAQVGEIELNGFDVDELVELVRVRTGQTPLDSNVRALQLRTGGLPFFAAALLDALVERGIDLGASTDLAEVPLPRRASTAILHRVFSLGHDARSVASACSLLTAVRLELLDVVADLAGVPADGAADAFDRLIRASILVEADDGFRFEHDLVRQALYDDLAPATRRMWHGKVADALSHRRSADRPRQIIEIAEHLQRGIADRNERSAALLREAGDMVLFEAPQSAAGWYRSALARVAPESTAVPDLQLSLSQALDLGGHHAESARVAAIARSNLPAGGVRERGTAITAHAAFAMGRLDRAAALLDDGLADSPARSGRLLLDRARLHLWQGRLDDSLADLTEARQRGLGHRVDSADAVQMQLHFQQGNAAKGIELTRRLRQRLDDLKPSVQADVHLALRVVTAFNLTPADAIADDAMGDGHAMSSWHHAISAFALLRQGDLNGALARAALAEAGSPGQAVGLLHSVILAVEMCALTELGDLVRAADVERRVQQEGATLVLPLLSDCAIARLQSVRGQHDAAIGTLDGAVDDAVRTGRQNFAAMALAELVECAVAAGQLSVARAASARLGSLRNDGAAVAPRMHLLLSQALAEQDLDAARAARELALVHGLAIDAGRALALIGHLRGDVDVLSRAHDELGERGASVRQEQVIVMLRQHGSHSPKGQRRRGGSLTSTEAQIARLVAEGLGNRAIAERVFLSPKTVEVYLSRIFAMTGCRSRVQLALAVQRGTVEGVAATA